MKNKAMFTNKNYNFYSQTVKLLRSEDKYFAHVTKSNLMTIQVRNTSINLYIISNNFKIDYLRNYDEEKCFLTHFENYYFVVTSAQIMNVRALTIEEKKQSFQVI